MTINPLERRYLGADRLGGWRLSVYAIIFEADTPWGKAFDVGLILTILLSVVAVIMASLRASRRKITIFLVGVTTLVVILGSLMYMIEGAGNGFTSIPTSVYWAIVTLTTVGYGDISPQTTLGQALAAIVMITGYAIIAVPTGIVTAEMTRRTSARRHGGPPVSCGECGLQGHDGDARHCKGCGAELP